MSARALIVIDLQNDYFPDGRFPLWNTEATLGNVEQAIRRAGELGVPVVHIQHIASGDLAPFFQRGTPGAEIHPRIRAAAPDAPVVVKTYADSFDGTVLEETLAKVGASELLLCGMMTQNCVTHTALSRAAEKYRVAVLGDCCTTVSEMLHHIALHAVSRRLPVVSSGDVL